MTRAERRSLFLGCFAIYVAIGALLAFHFSSFNGDAQARLANAYYVLFSRDPHMAAIGFVWNPLPSVLLLPVLPFKFLWPALSTKAFAGNIESAAFMAAAVCVLRGIVIDLRVPRTAGWLVVGAFALNPMVLYYGGNGMSEALFLVTLLLATRYLMRWLVTDSLLALALAGVWIGIAYLARNEAIASGAAAVALVAGRSFWRAAGDRRQRLVAAAADAVIVGMPVLTSFIGWAGVSWVITGHPFEQFSSQYGTSAQLQLVGNAISVPISRPVYELEQVLSYAPLLIPLLVAVAVWMWRRRDLRPLAVAAVPGGVLAFAVLGYMAGMTAGWYRYTITALPCVFVLTACLLSDPGRLRPVAFRDDRIEEQVVRVERSFRRPLVAVAVAGALLLPSLPGTAWAMTEPLIGREEYLHLSWAMHGIKSETDRSERDRWDTADEIAKYLDDLHLPNGKVIADTFDPCMPFIVLASQRPKQFVITNDRDFQPVLADPITFHAEYLLLPPVVGYGTLDAINVAYPDLYDKGAGLATLVHTFTRPACPSFRLYKVTGAASDTAGQTVQPRGVQR